MTEAPTSVSSTGKSTIGRSVLCLFVGFVVVVVTTLITDVILHWIHFYPPLGEYTPGSLLIWATIYRTIYGVFGSYVTAALAPNRPMMHALIGGAIGTLLATAGAIATWNHVPPLGPHWYPVSLIIGALPTAWLGAQIRIMQTSSRQ